MKNFTLSFLLVGIAQIVAFITFGQQWQNFVPNYSFENVTDNFSSSSAKSWNLQTKLSDSLAQNSTRKYNQGIYLQLYWPAFPSSIGYFMEWQLKPKIGFEANFAFCTAPTFSQSWNYGLTLSQSFLFGKKIKPRIGFFELAVCNPQQIQRKFESYTPTDRPSAYIVGMGINLGVDFPLIKKKLYLSPLGAACLIFGTGDTVSQRAKFRSDVGHIIFTGSFGIQFKYVL